MIVSLNIEQACPPATLGQGPKVLNSRTDEQKNWELWECQKNPPIPKILCSIVLLFCCSAVLLLYCSTVLPFKT